MQQLILDIAEGLAAQCGEIGGHWLTQARSVAPRASGTNVAGDPARNTRICIALVTAFRGEARYKDDVMRAGWELGDVAFTTGSSHYHLLKEIDLLESMLLYAAQRIAADARYASAADGIAVARKLSDAVSLFVRAASTGFMHAYLGEQQERSRALRHDLRNSLGTIQGAVSLMGDQSVAPETRNDPRFRTMVARNASTLDALIADRLSDAATIEPGLAPRDVSLRDVALAVRRDLRSVARQVGCEVEIDGDVPVVHTDTASLEFALRSLLLDALCAARSGNAVHVALGQSDEAAVTIEVRIDGTQTDTGHRTDEMLDLARELSALTGAQVWRDPSGAVFLKVPLSVPLSAAAVSVPIQGSDDGAGPD